MNNAALAKKLQFVADALELTGANPFRVKAYANAAYKIDRMEEPLFALHQQGMNLQESGLGKGMAADVALLLQTGTLPLIEQLQSEIPIGVFEMLQLRGMGVKKVSAIWKNAGIDNLNDLESAIQENRLQLAGFGDKIKQNILEQIPQVRFNQTRRRFADALFLAEPFLSQLSKLSTVEEVRLVGEMRRKLPVVSGVDILVATTSQIVFQDGLFDTQPSDVAQITPLTFEIAPYFQGRVFGVNPQDFALKLWELTATTDYQETFRTHFFQPKSIVTESEIYQKAGLPFVPPELRETGATLLEIQQKGEVPKLITVGDLKGVLHNHSTYSDGANTLREMAEACRTKGWQYFGIADHSQSLKIANGLSVERVLQQRAEIEKLNNEFEQQGLNFRIFGGIESDILEDGGLDYPDEILLGFDYVVASVHQQMNMTEEKATARLIKAIEHPATTILGHPTGRLLLRREGYPINHQKILEACAQNAVSIELNANPYRLDLDWTWIRKAIDLGVYVSINPDAHSVAQLDYVEWGVAVARKGWLEAQHCLNALNLADFTAWLNQK